MTLDVLAFIPEKDGIPDEIRESQKKRGLSTEVVDEVIEMYKAWVKSTCSFSSCSDIFRERLLCVVCRFKVLITMSNISTRSCAGAQATSR